MFLPGMTSTSEPRSNASTTMYAASVCGKVKRMTQARSVGAISATTS